VSRTVQTGFGETSGCDGTGSWTWLRVGW